MQRFYKNARMTPEDLEEYLAALTVLEKGNVKVLANTSSREELISFYEDCGHDTARKFFYVALQIQSLEKQIVSLASLMTKVEDLLDRVEQEVDDDDGG